MKIGHATFEYATASVGGLGSVVTKLSKLQANNPEQRDQVGVILPAYDFELATYKLQSLGKINNYFDNTWVETEILWRKKDNTDIYYLKPTETKFAKLFDVVSREKIYKDFPYSSLWDRIEYFSSALAALLAQKAVHANCLRADLEILFGRRVESRFDQPIKEYLLDFYRALSSNIPVIRCAAMITFELHAERMITSLWGTITKCFAMEKHRLKYFDTHLGGDDPAEAYPMQMTKNLVDVVVKKIPSRDSGQKRCVYISYIFNGAKTSACKPH